MLQEIQELVHYLIAMHLSELEIVTAFLNESIRGAVIKNIYRSRGGILLKLYGGSVDQVFISNCFRWIFPVSDVTLFPREPIGNREESLRKFMKGQRLLSISVEKECGKMVVFESPYRKLKIPLYSAAITIVEGQEIVWREKSRPEPKPLTKPMHFIEPATENAKEYESLFIANAEGEKDRLLQKEIAKRVAALQKLHTKVATDLEQNRKTVKKSTHDAQLLQQWFYTLDSHARKESVILTDAQGEEKTILLNPTHTLAWNMESKFSRVKKAKRGIEMCSARLNQIEADLANVSSETLQPLTKQQPTKPQRKEQKHSAYHLFRSPTNTLFFVGKGAKDNDELTMKLSSPHDYWFHVQHAHGSHVIMKTAKGKTPTKEQILHGCMLALFYSKAKKSARAEVWYTQRKYLRKPKGAAPGAVIITKGKSLFVVLEQTILDELVKE